MLLSETTFNLVFASIIFCYGATIGSFLNVVGYRVPLEMSIISPPSTCPKCNTRISILGLIPILGYFLIGCKCQNCKQKISFQYPLIEFLTAIITVFVFFKYTSPAEFYSSIMGSNINSEPLLGRFRFQFFVPMLTAYWLLYTGIALSIIDFHHQILPDIITLPGTLVGLVLGSLNPWLGWQESLLGAFVGSISLFLVAKLYEIIRHREGLGFGDVKYLAFIGAVVGLNGVLWVITIASVLGLIVGLAVAIKTKGGLVTAIPFGPFLAFGAFVECLYGMEIRAFLFPM